MHKAPPTTYTRAKKPLMEILSLSLLFIPSLPYPSSLWDLPSFTIFLFSLTAIQSSSVLFGSVNTLSISISISLCLPCLSCLSCLFASTLPLNSTQHKQTRFSLTRQSINQSIRLGACLPACRPTGFLARAAFPVPGLVISTSPPPSLRSLTLLLCTIGLAIAGGVFFEWGRGGGGSLGLMSVSCTLFIRFMLLSFYIFVFTYPICDLLSIPIPYHQVS